MPSPWLKTGSKGFLELNWHDGLGFDLMNAYPSHGQMHFGRRFQLDLTSIHSPRILTRNRHVLGGMAKEIDSRFRCRHQRMQNHVVSLVERMLLPRNGTMVGLVCKSMGRRTLRNRLSSLQHWSFQIASVPSREFVSDCRFHSIQYWGWRGRDDGQMELLVIAVHNIFQGRSASILWCVRQVSQSQPWWYSLGWTLCWCSYELGNSGILCFSSSFASEIALWNWVLIMLMSSVILSGVPRERRLRLEWY